MSGYDQFFKTAQAVKKGTAPSTPQFKLTNKAKPKVAAKKSTSEDSLEELRLRKAFNVKPKRSQFPWSAAAGLAVCLFIVGIYLAAPQKVEGWLKSFEILPMGQALASEEKAAETSKAKDLEKAKSANDGKENKTGPESKESSQVLGHSNHFEKLTARKEELDQREKELTELEEELQRQKVELEKRLAQLEAMRTEIATTLKDRVEVDQEKVTKLVDLYSNMKPKQAADVIGSLNDDLAVEVLAKMKKKIAAEIMNLIPAEKARALSEKYTGYRRKLAGN